jgi:hypothetical protein|tara:strand:- start:6651 stop:7205 length:555 start_codon:yes stop_codon:yes gene_type:complete
MSKILTDVITIQFANLHKPDDKFGADSANFNVTVPLTDELQAQIKKAVASTGAKKVNGVYEKDGEKFIKFKNRIAVKDGLQAFPCVDSQNQPTTVTAAGGDDVRLLVSPRLLSRDSSMSVYLDGVQIINKNSQFGGGGGGGFDVVEGGYVAGNETPAAPASGFEAPAAPAAPAIDEDDSDDLPF